MSYDRCKLCHEFGWVKGHKCYRFEVNIPQWTGDDWTEVWARDMETAAKKEVEQMDQDSAEYAVAGSRSSPTVHVRNGSAILFTECKTFEVSGEALPHYYAKEVEPTP